MGADTVCLLFFWGVSWWIVIGHLPGSANMSLQGYGVSSDQEGPTDCLQPIEGAWLTDGEHNVSSRNPVRVFFMDGGWWSDVKV